MKRAVFRWTVTWASALSAALTLAAPASAQEDDESGTAREGSPGSDEPSGGSTEDRNASESGSNTDDAHESSASKDDESDENNTRPENPAGEAAPPAKEAFARVWVGVAGSMDVSLVRSGHDVCPLGASGKPVNSIGAFCTTPYGADFPAPGNPAQNAALVPGQAGALDGGLRIGDVRALIAADYAVTSAILVGLRAGYVFNAYPGAAGDRPDFLKHLHLEARGTYAFGKDPLFTVGFAPVAFFGAGVAAADVHARTDVALVGVRGKNPVDAWQLGGPGFVTLGGGARYNFSPRAAFTLAWRFALSFGSPAALFTMAPEVAFQYGF